MSDGSALLVGVPLFLIGLAVTGLVVSGGAWTISHMYPILWISVPMLIIGVTILTVFLVAREKRRGDQQ
jgi:hypothetical protein